ncbi:MAG: shikimate kinase [Clostridiales bacterium]|nr:shikimate kinase [Clostridiales bacterium]
MRYGLIGEKLGHSYSPRLHALLGDGGYELRPLPREELNAFLTAGDFLGLNVTIPYKQAVATCCAALSDTARSTGSVNTVVRRADGTLYGDNTDAFGFSKMAEEAGIGFAGRKALVLGSGGTGKTACHVIREAGGEPVLISRGGQQTYADIDRHADAEILVNATPVGMFPQVEGVALHPERLPRLQSALDVIYNPLRTRFLQEAEAMGARCAGGLSMLVWQAARARELFDGRAVDPETVRAAESTLRREITNLVIVGMPGSGKTSVGKRCAAAMNRPFFDTDDEIERRAGKPIPRIFAEDGEAVFRALETEVIAALGLGRGQVIATGGGAVLRPENRLNLRMNGRVVYLTRPLERLATHGRPLSSGPEALRRMEQERASLYRACADATVANESTLDDCVREVMRQLS